MKKTQTQISLITEEYTSLRRTLIKTHLLSVLIFSILFSFFSGNLNAQTTYTWTGVVSTAWNNGQNWLPSTGFPDSTDNVVITSSGFSPLLNITRSVNNFTQTNGTLDLNTFTLSVTGTALFNSGNINNGTIVSSGTIATFNSTTFGANVWANCANILLNGCVFNGTATLEKNGASNNFCQGGNVFNSSTSITNSGSGILDLANNIGDDFNGDVTFMQTGSARISPLVNGYSTFAGNISTVGSNSALSFGYTWSSGRMIIDGNSIQDFNGSASFPPSVRTLSIATAGSTLNLNVKLTILGDLMNNGSLQDSGPGITLAGTSPQQIGGNSLTTFKNLTLDNSTGSYLSANVNMSDELTISAGTFSTTGYDFTLISNANGTARIAPILGNFEGNITMERYIAAGVDDWRFLASPVSGATINDWQDDFITTGFPGSWYPNFNFVSIYNYDETILGTSENGYNGAVSASDPLTPGTGFWCYLGSLPITVDVTGPPVKFNHTFSVSYSPSSAGTLQDGWVMIGNPYPCPIDWSSSSWTKANINDAVYIWNPTNQQYASWVSGVGTNGGSSMIASSQSFWIQTNASNPVLSCTENVKVSNNTPFLRQESSINFETVKLKMSGNGYTDETVIRFGNTATQDHDASLDARKMYSSNLQVPGLASLDSMQNVMSINSMPALNSQVHIPVQSIVGTSGIYTISVDEFPSGYCVVMEDLATNIKTNLGSGATYSFYIQDTTSTPRFLIHLSARMETEVSNASCNNYTNGKIIAQGKGDGPWNYTWYDQSNTMVKQTINCAHPDTLKNLIAGNYLVQVLELNGICPVSASTITVSQPAPVIADFVTQQTLNVGDGLLLQNTSSGAARYEWNFGEGDTSTDIDPNVRFYTVQGSYSIQLIASNAICKDTLVKSFIVFDPTLVTEQNMQPGNAMPYPNPSKDKVYFPARSNGQVFVYSNTGQLIMKENLIPGINTINMEQTAPGVYLYRVSFEDKSSYAGKLVKE